MRRSPLIITFVGLTIILVLVGSGQAQKPACTELQGRRALDEAVALRTWNALHRSYKQYRECDDGAIAEGYSESVARILVDHWDSLIELDHIASSDPAFRRFVLKHLDATLNTDDVETVKKKAKGRCPSDLRALCKDLFKQADSVIKEAN